MSDWQIIEGDCLDVMATLPSASVDAIICDPPYGTTACKWDTVIPFAPMWEQVKRVAKPRAAIVMFGSQPFTSALVMSNPKWFRYEWVWEKSCGTGFLDAKKRPLRCHENICVFCDGQPMYNPQRIPGPPNHSRKTQGMTTREWLGEHRNTPSDVSGLKYPRSVQRFDKHSSIEKLHPTQKPQALLSYLVKTYTNPGDVVLDFAMGSGTTGAACIENDRHFIGIESHPPYVEIARRRLTDAAAQPRLALTA